MLNGSTSRRSVRPAPMALFTMRRSLTNWPHAFYAARGFKQFADLYLRNARYGYLRWGAVGKVRQLNETYPYLRQEDSLPGPTSTIGAPLEHLDLATVIKVSQAVSGEIVQENLIDTLMHTAMEQAGAERALLIMPGRQEPRIEAEATTSGDTVTVRLVDEAVTERVLPESVLHYVLRTREIVILDDAAAQSPFGVDSYIRQRQARSILCLPLLNRAKLIGVLYLENNLTPRVFAPARISVLKLLASQAAIALENAHLYRNVAEREKQQTATSDMLRLISNSPIHSVLDAVADNAARLCDANNAEIFRLEDNLLRLAASYGEIPVVIHAYQGVPVNRDTVTGRAACDRRTIHVHDLAAEEGEYPVGSSNAKTRGPPYHACDAVVARGYPRWNNSSTANGGPTVLRPTDRAYRDLHRPGGDRHRKRAPLRIREATQIGACACEPRSCRTRSENPAPGRFQHHWNFHLGFRRSHS